MDEMKIVSKFMRGLVAKIIKNSLKKSGYDVEIGLNNLYVSVDDNNVAHLKIDATADIPKNVLMKIVDDIS